MDKEKLDTILAAMNSQLTRANDKLKSFKEKLLGDPSGTFEWADSSMEAAAVVDTFDRVVKALTAKDTKATPESIYEHAMEQVMKKAQYPGRSSSVCSNAMATHTLSAWAQVAVLFKPQ